MAAQQNPRASELHQDDWLLLDATVQRLEEAWRTQANPQLAQFVPPCTRPLQVRVLVELVKVDQERRWETGDHRFLEDYLAQWPELAESPDVLAELVEAECLTCAVVDRLPTADELAHRFPAIARRIDLDRLAQMVVREDFTVRMRTHDTWSNDTIPTGSADTPVLLLSGGTLPVDGQLGRYMIRAVLGRGGMGTVYRAYDPQLDRDVALKIPRFDPVAEPELLERFVREARVAARIRHPHVCPVYDAGRADGVPYLTMALIDGGSLEDRMKQGVLSPHDAIEMVRKLAAGLEAIHLSGMVHRDIKPSNVLIDRAGEPLLADFGLARPLTGMDVMSTAGLFSGTPAYMAPEQVAGRAVDARTDVYSLAVLLWRLMTGTLPFAHVSASTPGKASPNGAQSVEESGTGVDADLAAICKRALSQDPADRQSSAREFADELAAYLVGRAERAPQPNHQLACGPDSDHFVRAVLNRRSTHGSIISAESASDAQEPAGFEASGELVHAFGARDKHGCVTRTNDARWDTSAWDLQHGNVDRLGCEDAGRDWRLALAEVDSARRSSPGPSPGASV